MSVRKLNIDFPDTLRTLERRNSVFKTVRSVFITPADFTFTDLDDFCNQDTWYDNLGINIFPIHRITEFTEQAEPTEYKKSLQNFDVKVKKGKYKHKLKLDVNLELHQLLNDFSGQQVNIIYADSENNIRATYEGTEIRGFKVDAIELEKIMFPSNNSTGDSDLFVELLDSDELNVNGVDVELDWLIEQMDRMYLNINVAYEEDTINLYVSYNGENIENLTNSDITLYDFKNGAITYSLFVPGSGVYTLGGFSKDLTEGCINVQSTIYIGTKRYRWVSTIIVVSDVIFMDGDDFAFMDDDDMIFLNN